MAIEKYEGEQDETDDVTQIIAIDLTPWQESQMVPVVICYTTEDTDEGLVYTFNLNESDLADAWTIVEREDINCTNEPESNEEGESENETDYT